MIVASLGIAGPVSWIIPRGLDDARRIRALGLPGSFEERPFVFVLSKTLLPFAPLRLRALA